MMLRPRPAVRCPPSGLLQSSDATIDIGFMTSIPVALLRRLSPVLFAVAMVAVSGSAVKAQQPIEPSGAIAGTVSTQKGSVKLPGALISIRDTSDAETAELVSNEDGEFAVPDLPAARYRVRASLDGFQSAEGNVEVQPGGIVHLSLDLSIAVAERVDVVASAPVGEIETLASSEAVKSTETQLIAPG